MDECIGRVSMTRALALLRERGDSIGQSSLSRYVSRYADALDPQREGSETTIDFETLAQHRKENINRPESAPVSVRRITEQRGRADESTLNIRAQRQMRELEIAERIGALTPTREVQAAAVLAVSALRNSFALALNDAALVIANVCGVEPRIVRPHLKVFEKKGLDAFVRTLAERGFDGERPPA
jgi:hypothetical protein